MYTEMKYWATIIFVIATVAAVTWWIRRRRHQYSICPKKNSKTDHTIPGPVPKNVPAGHMGLVSSCGSLHEFLSYLHARYGPIVAFFWGKERVVSTACPSLFKEQAHLSDRPASIFRMLEPLFGKGSISFANGSESMWRHRAYAMVFNDEAIKQFYGHVQKIADSIIKDIPSDADFPLKDNMFDFAIKSMLRCLFGVHFNGDTKKVAELREVYYELWADLETRLDGSQPEPGSERERIFAKNKQTMVCIIKKVVNDCRENPQKCRERLFVDALLEAELTDEAMTGDMLEFFVSGFQTTALLLTWCQYYLGSNPGIEEKVYEELITHLDDSEMVTVSNAHKLKYLSQVIDETLRCSTLIPFTARCSKHEVVLGNYRIPAETPIIQALGVVHEDPKIFPQPEDFDPERFAGIFNHMKGRSPYAFVPFGFAGERKCFGYKLAQVAANVWLSTFIRKYRIEVVYEGEINKAYGFITNPSQNVKLRLIPRY